MNGSNWLVNDIVLLRRSLEDWEGLCSNWHWLINVTNWCWSCCNGRCLSVRDCWCLVHSVTAERCCLVENVGSDLWARIICNAVRGDVAHMRWVSADSGISNDSGSSRWAACNPPGSVRCCSKSSDSGGTTQGVDDVCPSKVEGICLSWHNCSMLFVCRLND